MARLKIFKIMFCLCILTGFLCQSAYSGEGALKKVSFVPMWKPQAQFAGYYVAYEKGIYKKHGLDVTIIPGGPDFPAAELLENGKADLGIMWLASAIQRRAAGLRLINIGQFVQRSALMLVAKKSSGILKPEDMNGKKINLWEGDLQIQPRVFLKKYNIDAKIIPQSYTVNLFLAGGVDVVSAMWYNEYHTILNSGLNDAELSKFFFDAYGLNFPEDGIYVLEKTFKKDAQIPVAFIKASVEGWLYAFQYPDEALDIVLKYMKEAGVSANRVHQKWMLSRMKDIMIPRGDLNNIGILNKEDYERVAQELKKDNLIKEIPDFNEFHKLSK